MATFTGHFLNAAGDNSAVSSNLALRQAFYDTIDFASGGEAFLATSLESGFLSNVPTNPAANNHSGSFLAAYAEIFYNRIIITPNPLAVGNIVADKDFQLSVFNAFFTSTNLEAITEDNLGGISIGLPAPPTLYGPLQEIVYTVTAKVDVGPPTIAGTYTFDFAGTDKDISIGVVGARVLPLPYLFQAGLSETLNWKTKVLTSNDGSEQRMKLLNAPRVEYNFNIAIPRNQIPQLDSLLYGWRGNFYGLPISSEARKLITPTSSSSPNIEVNTEFADFREEGLALIYESPTSFEIVSILSYTTNQIITEANITKIYGDGALVMPLQIARLQGNPTRSTSGDSQRLSAKFQLTENINLPATAALVQYKGLDVYLDEPLTLDQFATDTYNARVDVIDFGTGVIDIFTPWKKTKTRRVFGLQFDNQEDTWNYKLWLHRRAGRSRPFWMPTFEVNFTSVSTGALTTQIEVLNEGQHGLVTERNDLAILTTTGWIFREIDSVASFGDNLLITVNPSLAINADTIKMISFLGRKRLASDKPEIIYGGNTTGKASVSIIEINN